MPPLAPHPDDAAFLEELTEVGFEVARQLGLALRCVEHKRRPHPGGRAGLCYYWEGRVSLTLRYRSGSTWWDRPRSRYDAWRVLAHELAHLKDPGHGAGFKRWEDRCRAAVADALERRGAWPTASERLRTLIAERSSTMKKADVQVGDVYAVKVSGDVCPVVIDEEHPNGGWTGTNQHTGRQVRIKSARRLRQPWDEYLEHGDGDEADTAPEGEGEAESKPEPKQIEKTATHAKTGAQDRGLSGLDAAAKVLEEAGEALGCKAIVERAFEAGYWQSDGKTPAATIYSALLREIQSKGENARFKKAGRGLFELAD
jgi:hypothetical protein